MVKKIMRMEQNFPEKQTCRLCDQSFCNKQIFNKHLTRIHQTTLTGYAKKTGHDMRDFYD